MGVCMLIVCACVRACIIMMYICSESKLCVSRKESVFTLHSKHLPVCSSAHRHTIKSRIQDVWRVCCMSVIPGHVADMSTRKKITEWLQHLYPKPVELWFDSRLTQRTFPSRPSFWELITDSKRIRECRECIGGGGKGHRWPLHSP